MCVFLFCLRRLYKNDSQEIKACKPTNIGVGAQRKRSHGWKIPECFGRERVVEEWQQPPQSCEGKGPESLGGVVIKELSVTCGQDRRLLFWETGLTHCVCARAETPKSVLASFLQTEQGPLCSTSQDSTLEAATELIIL